MPLIATLEGLRDRILDSIKGRKLGLTPEGFLAGHLAPIEPLQAATTSTTGTNLTNYGTSTLSAASTTANWTLAAPMPGVQKDIRSISTGAGTVTLASGTFITTAGSTTTIAQWPAAGGLGVGVTLIGLSTALYAIRNFTEFSSAAGTPAVTFS